MARLVDEGWMRTTKSPSQLNDMAELCDEQYYNGYYGVSKTYSQYSTWMCFLLFFFVL